jgi:hypothetical protein
MSPSPSLAALATGGASATLPASIAASAAKFAFHAATIFALTDFRSAALRVFPATGAVGGFKASPIVVNDTVFIGSQDGFFYALDARRLGVAEEAGADLVVVGSHRPAMKDYLLGTNAARVVRHARCSVLVARAWLDRFCRRPQRVIPLSDRSTKAVLEVMARGQHRFVHDSLLEEEGFEPSVPRRRDNAFRD